MAQMIITIPDAQVSRVVTALSNNFGYQPTIPDPNNPGQTIPNPQTAAQFAKQQVIGFVMSIVKNYESSQAVQQAKDTATANVDNQVQIT